MSLATLTTREREVTDWLCRGYTNRQIAKLFSISQKTVDTHRGKIMRKTGAKNNVQLTLMALRSGVVDLDPAVPSRWEVAVASP